MSSRSGEPPRPWIDTGEFARAGSVLSGRVHAAELPRLRDLLADDEGAIAWELAGERRARPGGGRDSFLRLRFDGAVHLRCVRCLEPVEARLAQSRLLRLAASEEQAAREDADAEEFDVIATSRRLDVLELLEDEVIMALPIAPRHDACALPAGAGAPGDADDARRPGPFAALRGLKTD